jgi:F420H(2)-dependent quinone reductase
MREGQNVIVLGANLGQATDPRWVHNERAHPDTDIQIASDVPQYCAVRPWHNAGLWLQLW